MFSFSHSPHGCSDARSRLISSSAMMRPCSVSTRKMRPGAAALQQDVLLGNVQHADLGRHDDEIVLRDVVSRRPQAVAVEHRADHLAVGERNRRRPVPRLHHRRVVLVEGLPLGRHRFVPAHGSGIIMSTACGSERPVMTRNSSTLSKVAVSLPPRG